MEDYKYMIKRLENRRRVILALAFIPALLFPLAFMLITRFGGYIALSIALFYIVTGFLAIYLSNK
jgi:hypothetical protein